MPGIPEGTVSRDIRVHVLLWQATYGAVGTGVRSATSVSSLSNRGDHAYRSSLSGVTKVYVLLLKADEATHIDEIVERLEPQLSSSEIFAALFELELAGKVKQLPGKNFVKSF